MGKDNNNLKNKDLKDIQSYFDEVIPDKTKDKFNELTNQKIKEQKKEVEKKKKNLKEYSSLRLKNLKGFLGQF